MLREIYFRDPSDMKFVNGVLEVSDKLEAVITKLRMILYTNRGEVLGEPELGMDLENYLFESGLNEGIIKDRFYANLAKYVPETADFQIDCSVTVESDGVKDTGIIYITLNNEKILGVQI